MNIIRFLEEIAIQIPALPRPTFEEMWEKSTWDVDPSRYRIERDFSPTEAVNFRLATVMREDERLVEGNRWLVDNAEIEGRLGSKLPLCPGYQHAAWLEEHQNTFPNFQALLGKVHIEFRGLIVAGLRGGGQFPYFYAGDRWISSRWTPQWVISWMGIERGLDHQARIAISNK